MTPLIAGDWRVLIDRKRRRLGLSRAALARATGLSQAHVQDALNLRKDFSADNYRTLFVYLGFALVEESRAGTDPAARERYHIGPHNYLLLWEAFAAVNREAIDNADPDTLREYLQEAGTRLPRIGEAALRQNALTEWVKKAFYYGIKEFHGRGWADIRVPPIFRRAIVGTSRRRLYHSEGMR